MRGILDYGPPVQQATVGARGNTLHFTVTVAPGTDTETAEAVIHHAFGLWELAEEAAPYHLGINVQYPDGQMIVSMAADRAG